MSRQLDTGTGHSRRRLTLEEAQRGDCPTGFTREEWKAMEIAAGEQGRERIARIVRETLEAQP